VARQKEVQAVGMTIAEALKAEGKAEGRAEGKAEGRAEGKAEGRLDNARELLQGLLEEKFGALPEAVRQRIQAASDLARLNAAVRGVLHLGSLEQLQL
jgi:predicted transposase YdaD